MAQRFIPNSDPSKSRWEDTGPTPVILPATRHKRGKEHPVRQRHESYHPPGEIGPPILRPDGTVFKTGANCNVKGPPTDPNACVIYQPIAHTAIYDTKTNSWTAGPDLPHRGGRGRYLRQPAAERECPFPNQFITRTHDPLARANARYASIRNGTMHLISAEAEGTQQSACPPGFHISSTSSTARNSSPSRKPPSAGSPARCSCRPAK